MRTNLDKTFNKANERSSKSRFHLFLWRHGPLILTSCQEMSSQALLSISSLAIDRLCCTVLTHFLSEFVKTTIGHYLMENLKLWLISNYSLKHEPERPIFLKKGGLFITNLNNIYTIHLCKVLSIFHHGFPTLSSLFSFILHSQFYLLVFIFS